MSDRGTPDEAKGKKPLDDFLAECILVLEQHGDAALEELLAARPELATKARARIRGLQASGLLAPADPDPERIGPYRVRERLGSGGMGTVYLALQDGDLERRVAIKVVKRGMDSREVLARFALERQALAMLDHQNIAKVLDAGQTDDGRPFLVMEYVSGLPITKYCDERRLSIRERIQLFCLVCEAVQHAHHKGLVHRDLKPSNILVADREGRAWPIVIDFGVAKSLGGSLSAQSLMTARGRVLGTPEYMSPEQAANEMDVDTRTDVFSLGVVLFELLTSTLPIDSSTLRRADSGELSRILRSFDTPAPSRRVTTLVGSVGPAMSRHTDLPQLRRTLRGDLDWITLRALERDRNRRYGMPGELAADLQRHLRNEPVLAGPPGALYRWQKFFARNRLQATAAAIVLLALVGGLGVSVAGYRAAAASARQSDADFGAAVAAIERLVFFGDDRLADEPQMDEVRRHLLQDALAFYERIAKGHSDDPRLALRIAESAARAGRIQYMLGDADASLASMDRARIGFERLADRLPTAEHVAFVDSVRGQAMGALGRTRDAETTLRQAVAEFAAVPVERRTREFFASTWFATAGHLAHMVRLRDPVAARPEYEAALRLAAPWLEGGGKRTVSNATGIAESIDVWREGVARALAIAVEHASLLHQLGDVRAAAERAEALHETMVAEWEVRSESERRALAESARHLGALFVALALPEEANELLDLAVAQLRWMCSAHPAQSSNHRRLALVLNTLADLRARTGDLDGARVAGGEAVRVLEALVARAPGDGSEALLGKLVITDARIRAAPRNLGGEVDTPAIDAALRRGIALLENAPAEVRSARDTRVPLTLAWVQLAANHQSAGRVDEALVALEHATAETEAMVAAEPALPELRRNLVDRRLDLAELAAAASLWSKATALLAAFDAEAAATKQAMPMLKLADLELRVSRLRMRVAAGRGDVDAVLAEVRAPEVLSRDWNGKQKKAEALLLLVEAIGPADARRLTLLAEARDLLTKALAYGEDADLGTEAMVAVMVAQTADVLVRVERAAGDLAAAAKAAERVVLGYEPSFRDKPSERNRDRLARAGDAWCGALADAGDPAGLQRAIERLAECFVGRPADLARIAVWCDRLATIAVDPSVREAALAKGRALRSAAK